MKKYLWPKGQPVNLQEIKRPSLSEKLAPFGKTLQDACEFYLKYLRDAERSISVSDLIDEYLATQVRLKRSQAHLYDLRQRLGRHHSDAVGKT